MIIKTKRHRLKEKTYIKLAFLYLIKGQALFLLATLPLSAYLFLTGWTKMLWGVNIGLVLYLLFWFLQFYGVTFLEQSKIIFQGATYHITSKEILMMITTKQGMPIPWDKIRYAYRRPKYFILFLSKGHFLYLPNHIFKSAQEQAFFSLLLKKKGYIR